MHEVDGALGETAAELKFDSANDAGDKFRGTRYCAVAPSINERVSVLEIEGMGGAGIPPSWRTGCTGAGEAWVNPIQRRVSPASRVGSN
jgi:hypothetical protein